MENKDVTVKIEYCEICNFHSQCIDVMNAIKQVCPHAVVSCTPGRRGSFEVTINDTLVHSKLAQLAFPSEISVAENVHNASLGKPMPKVQELPITDCVLQ